MTSSSSTTSYIRSLRPYSNSEVNRAASQLVKPSDPLVLSRAVEVVTDWRTLHYGSVFIFRAILDVEARTVDPGSFVVDRLKRLASIVQKLRRQPTMKLSTMQTSGASVRLLRRWRRPEP